MIKALQTYKKEIQGSEAKIIDAAIKNHPLRDKERLIEALISFVQAGKHVRSGLFLRALSWTNDHTDDDLTIAASIELIHSAMLIQDDIMDNDEIRRGQTSLHKQFEELNGNRRISEGMAVCASDLLIFTAFEAVSSPGGQVSDTIAQQLRHVTLGQLRDITSDDPWNDGKKPLKEDIIDLYANKTGRYTFTLPLQLAEIRADMDYSHLETIGKNLGIIFQLRDDELNVYSSSNDTGKPELSDIKENKQTVLRKLVIENNPEAEKYFGRSVSGKRDDIRKLFEKVEDKHEAIKEQYTKKTIESIESSNLPESGKKDLKALTKFVATRQK